MSNKTVLWIVKIVAAIFNFPATAYVFFDILSATDRPPAFVYFNLIFAVLLIDVFFLWVLGVLEDSKEDPIKRMPAALSSILLVIAIVWIGIKDEGILAFAPRIGLVVLVFNDWIMWATDFFQFYYSRERIEKRIRDREVIDSRRKKTAARKQAMKNLREELIFSQERSLIKQLGLYDEEPEPVVLDIPKESFDKDSLDDFISKNNKGFVWESPATGKVFHTTTQGKPYTERGARLALIRDIKKHDYTLQETT